VIVCMAANVLLTSRSVVGHENALHVRRKQYLAGRDVSLSTPREVQRVSEKATSECWSRVARPDEPRMRVRLSWVPGGHRIIVFDPRGMGGSTDVPGDRLTVEKMADDAAGLLRALHIKQADVLGWSLGGFVAQELAIRHARLVRRLVLASSSAGGRHATKASRKVTAIDEKSTIGLASPQEFLPILFPPAAQAAGQAWISRLLAQPGGCCEPYTQASGRRQVAADRRWYAPSGGDENRLAGIRAPTLIGAGALDVDVPVANARLLHRRVRGSRLLIYADAGHAFLIQHASQFAAAVLRFIR
jgi:pimeloyl-ACP methyl ester carboxylesterase